MCAQGPRRSRWSVCDSSIKRGGVDARHQSHPIFLGCSSMRIRRPIACNANPRSNFYCLLIRKGKHHWQRATALESKANPAPFALFHFVLLLCSVRRGLLSNIKVPAPAPLSEAYSESGHVTQKLDLTGHGSGPGFR